MRCRVSPLVLLLALTGVVRAARDKSCDDGSVLLPTCADVIRESASGCPDKTEILALQAGCFVCVDPLSCLVSYDEGAPKTNKESPAEGYELDEPDADPPADERYEQDPKYEDDPQDAENDAKGYADDLQGEEAPTEPEEAQPPDADADVHHVKHREPPSEIGIQPIQNEHAAERSIKIHAHKAAAEAAVAAHLNQPHAAMEEVSNWYFLIPAMLAMVSVGIAIRGRWQRRDVKFEHVDGEDDEEINPFCADPECNPQQDDDQEDLEYGGASDEESYRAR